MTRRLVMALALAIWGCSRPDSEELRSLLVANPVWLSDVRWQDKPERLPGQFASATVLLFQRNGDFRMAECTLTLLNGTVGISEGDGFVRYTGKWRVADGRVAVEYALNTPTRLVNKPLVTGPAKQSLLDVSTDADQVQIALSGTRFTPDKLLRKEGINLLMGL